MLKTLVKQGLYPLIKARPDFLIIGAQKAGTTSLYEYLTQHPQVVGNKSWKEIRYYDLPEHYNQGFSWYLSHFPSKLEKGDRLTFDASPSYLYFDYIPPLIRQDFGQIKMIAILRHPVDRAYSAWQMYHSFCHNELPALREIADARTFAEAIEDELNGKTSHYPHDYINRGKYAQQLQNYYSVFAKETLLVLNFDQMKKDLPGVLEQVCQFLAIDSFSPEILKQLQQQKHNVGKYERSQADLQQIARLNEYFVPYNQDLYQLVGENYGWS